MGRRVSRANTATHHHLPASSTVLCSYINARTYTLRNELPVDAGRARLKGEADATRTDVCASGAANAASSAAWDREVAPGEGHRREWQSSRAAGRRPQ